MRPERWLIAIGSAVAAGDGLGASAYIVGDVTLDVPMMAAPGKYGGNDGGVAGRLDAYLTHGSWWASTGLRKAVGERELEVSAYVGRTLTVSEITLDLFTGSYVSCPSYRQCDDSQLVNELGFSLWYDAISLSVYRDAFENDERYTSLFITADVAHLELEAGHDRYGDGSRYTYFGVAIPVTDNVRVGLVRTSTRGDNSISERGLILEIKYRFGQDDGEPVAQQAR